MLLLLGTLVLHIFLYQLHGDLQCRVCRMDVKGVAEFVVNQGEFYYQVAWVNQL